MLANIGLTIICLAWLYELVVVGIKKDKNIKGLFVGGYIIGVLLLVIDGFMLGATPMTWLNLVSLVFALGVGLSVIKK